MQRKRNSSVISTVPTRRYGWPRLMYIPDAAEYIGARVFFVEETLIRGKQVRVVPVGNRQCIPIEELDAWVDRQLEKVDAAV